jgi:hypothetical protein
VIEQNLAIGLRFGCYYPCHGKTTRDSCCGISCRRSDVGRFCFEIGGGYIDVSGYPPGLRLRTRVLRKSLLFRRCVVEALVFAVNR